MLIPSAMAQDSAKPSEDSSADGAEADAASASEDASGGGIGAKLKDREGTEGDAEGGADAEAGDATEEGLEATEIGAADEFKEAVGGSNEAVGSVVNTLDDMALSVGKFHVSMLDVVLVFVVIGLTILAAWLATRFSRYAIERIKTFDASQKLLADKLVSLVIWALAILIGLDILGIDLTAFAFFSGAFGLAIGFGLQKTFGNLIAGIILLMDRSIKPGDVIAIADQAGNTTFGQIRKIGIRAVSMTTRDEREYLIPNENLMVNQVENWSYSSRNVRLQVEVGISYHADMQLAEKLMLEAATSVPRVLKRPAPVVWMVQYGASSVDFVIHCWIRDPEGGVGNVKSEVLKKLWFLFQEHDIEIPFPQNDLNLRNTDAFEQLVAAISQRVDNRQQSAEGNSDDASRAIAGPSAGAGAGAQTGADTQEPNTQKGDASQKKDGA